MNRIKTYFDQSFLPDHSVFLQLVNTFHSYYDYTAGYFQMGRLRALYLEYGYLEAKFSW